MDWPSALPECDVIILRDHAADGRPCYVVQGATMPAVAFSTYAQAEGCACGRARLARGHAWYKNGGRLQLLTREAESRAADGAWAP